jgi:hypothetical protein
LPSSPLLCALFYSFLGRNAFHITVQ